MRRNPHFALVLFFALAHATPAGAEATETLSRDLTAALAEWTGRAPEALSPWADALSAQCSGRTECLALASVAFFESRLAPWVLDFRCNDAHWRMRQRSDWLRAHGCDSGAAYGAFQIHDPTLRGATPSAQVARALSILRRDPRAWSTWPQAARWAARWEKSRAPGA